MRIFNTALEAFKESERSLWEMGLDTKNAHFKTLRPWIVQIIKASNPLAIYKLLPEGEDLLNLVANKLESSISKCQEIYREHPTDFLHFPYIFQDEPNDIETSSIINRYLFVVNSKVNVTISSMSCSLYNNLPITWAMTMQFMETFASSNGLFVGSIFHTIHDLYEHSETLKSKEIF